MGFGLSSKRDLVRCSEIEHLSAVGLKLKGSCSYLTVMCYEGDIKRGCQKRSNGKLEVSQITFSLSTIRAGVGREEM